MRIVFCFLLVVVTEIFSLLTPFSLFAQQTNIPLSDVAKQCPSPPSVEIIAVDNRIKVLNAPVGSRLEIYSVVGIKVLEIEMKQASGEYTVNIAKGYYIIRIDETVRKIAIR
ncbi:MAG: hypothetical protein LBD89_09440 [Tannerellaceae bacterium]|jgi:hypothetical protein|nr:hypothetical protein [Tannerellaceae bacterium]